MSAMMGGEAASQEDMFAKLENMRSVITEVNTQFKDPVSTHAAWRTLLTYSTGENHFRLRLHLRVPVSLRD